MTPLQQSQRKAFLRQLNIGSQNVVELYKDIIAESNRVILSAPYPTSEARVNNILATYDQALVDTKPQVFNQTQGEMLNMANLGADHVSSNILQEQDDVVDYVARIFDEVISATVDELIEKVYPDGLTLSDRIWSPAQRQPILQEITRGYLQGNSTAEIAEDLMQYIKEGNGFKQAFRLAHTELVRTYSQTKLDSARAWNSSARSNFSVYIRQELSPAHNIVDICDVLEGDYDPDEPIPAIPRHPGCLCNQYEILEFKELTDYEKQLRDQSAFIEKNNIRTDVDFM